MEFQQPANANSWRAKIQRMGGFLSSMVMPNIGIFIAWGLMAAFFIPTGWTPNEHLNELVPPILNYLLPILIGYTGGYNVYGKRGGAIGALATMGVVVGADITMLIGGMIMGPIGAILMKKIDGLFKGKVKPGLEMLVDNFSLGFLGFAIALIGFVAVEPIFAVILSFISGGVDWLMARNLIPLTSIFVQPAQVLFLNNAVNHGIMIPLGTQQVLETGKSLLFLVEANGGAWVGLLIAFSMFGTGMAKKSAPACMLIQFLGGIGEVAFPYAMIKPITILGPIAGNMAALAIGQMFGGGTVGAVSPGSFLALLMMTPRGNFIINIAMYAVAVLVSFVVGAFFLKLSFKKDQAAQEELSLEGAGGSTAEGFESAMPELIVTENAAPTGKMIKNVIIACDAGMGSSAMGASMLSTKARKNMLEVTVKNVSVDNIPENADLIITNEILLERVKSLTSGKQIPILTIKNFLDNSEYDRFIKFIKENNEE
ncbi:PTS system mannitol-specific EIICB component [Enterococcus florum]|uniref:PTS system mannitol-specific EIICB component n=1 Tax=Enterococcus florum TaxID=2480627 RepID=A0A4P5P9D8_9ENTE|nr:PTS mannitol transporter subunit IICB [Enterococcus florum]GCF94176.1 PTS system mannitol-specific EIICB component [Enterococcus florum]